MKKGATRIVCIVLAILMVGGLVTTLLLSLLAA